MIDSAVTLLPHPGLANDSERASRVDIETDAVDRLDRSVFAEEDGLQIVDLEKGGGRGAFRHGDQRRALAIECTAVRDAGIA